jgi:adenylate cyclase
MESEIRRLFRQLEQDTERLSAYLRLLVVLTLAVLLLTTDTPDPQGDLALALIAYSAISLVAIALAYRRFFRPWLPWALVTLDIAVLWLLLALPARSMGMTATAVLTLPMASLVFVILAQTAMRYRPGLVVYAAALFMLGWMVSLLFADGGVSEMGRFAGRMGGRAGMTPPWHDTLQEAIRALMVVLTAVILAVTAIRAKGQVLQSITALRRAANLSRFMPESLVERLSAADLEQLRSSRRQDVAVMFTDIRGFTSLSERVEPAQLGAFLSEFRHRMAAPIKAHQGTVDKFIGDAIMAVFGVPQPGPEDAHNALNCAHAMLAALNDWNAERDAQGLDPVSVGIGLHYGSVFAGALGDESRLEYTVIGDCVNVAERLEKLTRTFDMDVVVSADLLEVAGAGSDPRRWSRLPVETLKGRSGGITAYGLRTRGNTAQEGPVGKGE